MVEAAASAFGARGWRGGLKREARTSGAAGAWLLGAALLGLPACSGEGEPLPMVEALAIRTEALPDGRLRDAYEVKLAVTGGTPPYAFAITDGALHDGLELKAATGQIAGVPAEPGRRGFTVRIDDAAGQRVTRAFTLYVPADPLELLTQRLPGGQEGEPYEAQLSARGGVPPLEWTLPRGELPPGLALSAEGGIAGTPTASGRWDFTVRVTDEERVAREAELSVALISRDPMVLTSTVPRGRSGAPYSARLAATGGTPPYVWSRSAGELPLGLALADDGSLTGTPQSDGSYLFTSRVTDARGHTDERELALEVVAPLTITTQALPQAVLRRAYDVHFEAAGGVPPYVWTLGGGTLPVGINFEAGRLHGASVDPGTYSLTVRVRDAEGFRASALFELRVTDRFVYEVTPDLAFPPVCTSTTISYQTATIEVPDSMQVLDVNVAVDVAFSGNNNPIRMVLVAPDGARAVLCGDGIHLGRNGAGTIPGGRFCQGSGGFRNVEYDDEGTRPERPLSAFDGMNPQGTWRLMVGVVRPNCNMQGTIHSVRLTIDDDRSPDDYVMVRGFTKNNLLLAPWVRIRGGGLDQHDLFLSATAYSAGPNGLREGGRGDDVQLPTVLTWAWAGTPITGTNLTPDGHVSAGPTTGSQPITASGGGLTVTVPLHVVPPDWHPASRRD